MRLVTSTILAFALAANGAAAATFNIFEANTPTLLGTFNAPAGGGALTSASIHVDGGIFDVLTVGGTAPVYDAVNDWITGAGSPFGSITNSVVYNTTDVNSNPITCGVGECFFSLTNTGGPPVPPEWYLDYVPLVGVPASIDSGHYEIKAAPIPLPATALLLAGALAGMLAMRRRTVRPS